VRPKRPAVWLVKTTCTWPDSFTGVRATSESPGAFLNVNCRSFCFALLLEMTCPHVERSDVSLFADQRKKYCSRAREPASWPTKREAVPHWHASKLAALLTVEQEPECHPAPRFTTQGRKLCAVLATCPLGRWGWRSCRHPMRQRTSSAGAKCRSAHQKLLQQQPKPPYCHRVLAGLSPQMQRRCPCASLEGATGSGKSPAGTSW